MTTITASLTDRHAVVCGSTQGIGRACAEALAAAGATVTLLARHPEGLAHVKDALATPDGQSHGVARADFSQLDTLRDAAPAILDARGPVHILVHNSGGPPAGPIMNASLDEFQAGFTQHLLAGQTLMQAFAPGMAEAKYGRLINIISTSVIRPILGLGVSNTIRGAVANWARTLAGELGPHGITVNNILPGFTDTARLRNIIDGRASRGGTTKDEVAEQMKKTIPARRFGAPEEVAAVCAFLASPAAGYVNGVNLPVDGGRLSSQ